MALHLQTTCIAMCGQEVCWHQRCEQGGGVMVCASISYRQRTQLHFIYGNLNAQRYRDEIRRPMFQHDNARPHVATICAQFLEVENVPVLPFLYLYSQSCEIRIQLKSEVYIHLSQIHLNSVFHNSWHLIKVKIQYQAVMHLMVQR